MAVMIVDDDPDSLDLIDRYVKSISYETYLVGSGDEAIELAELHKPDAMILDAIMPEVNGLDVLRALKRKKKTRNIPVIMVSALGPGIKLMLDNDTQADYYMSKPFSGKELKLVLRKLITDNDEIVCWVSFNDIRKESRAHVDGCIHVDKAKLKANPTNWKKYSSFETAQFESENKGYLMNKCKQCM